MCMCVILANGILVIPVGLRVSPGVSRRRWTWPNISYLSCIITSYSGTLFGLLWCIRSNQLLDAQRLVSAECAKIFRFSSSLDLDLPCLSTLHFSCFQKRARHTRDRETSEAGKRCKVFSTARCLFLESHLLSRSANNKKPLCTFVPFGNPLLVPKVGPRRLFLGSGRSTT